MTEKLWTERGSILSTGIFVYAATSPVGGYMGGALYSQLGGLFWIFEVSIYEKNPGNMLPVSKFSNQNGDDFPGHTQNIRHL